MILIRKNTKQTYFVPKEPFKNVLDESDHWMFKTLSCFYGYETIHCSFNDLIKILGSNVELDNNGLYRWYMKYITNPNRNGGWFFSVYSNRRVKDKDKKMDWLLSVAEKHHAHLLQKTLNEII